MPDIVKKDFKQTALEGDTRFKTLTENFISMREEIQKALPGNIDADRMLTMITSTIQKNPKLLKCTPQSLFGAFIQTALLGLNPALGESWIIPYKNNKTQNMEAQFQIGAKGYVVLAYRSNILTLFEATLRHSKDKFELQKGTHPIIAHTPVYESGNTEIVGVYAVAHFVNGSRTFEYMPIEEIEKHRMLSKSQKVQQSGSWIPSTKPLKVWKEHYGEMAKKTVMIRLCKYLPREQIGSQLTDALNVDGGIIQLQQYDKGILPENIEKPEYDNDSKVDEETGEIIQPPKRPYEPEILKHGMINSREDKKGDRLERSEKLVARYHAAFSNLSLKNPDERKQIQKFLFDADSSNDLTAEEMLTIINWIGCERETTEDGEIWIPNTNTLIEIGLLIGHVNNKSLGGNDG